MENLLNFLAVYGLPLTAIAVVGIILLGVMKYCNFFTKIDEKYRHWIYIGISVCFSVVGSIIYLCCIHKFDWNFILPLTAAIYALNQTFYNIFKVCTLNELCIKILDWIKEILKRKNNKPEGEIEDVEPSVDDTNK